MLIIELLILHWQSI